MNDNWKDRLEDDEFAGPEGTTTYKVSAGYILAQSKACISKIVTLG